MARMEPEERIKAMEEAQDLLYQAEKLAKEAQQKLMPLGSMAASQYNLYAINSLAWARIHAATRAQAEKEEGRKREVKQIALFE